MIPKGLFTQISMIVLAVGISFFYIEPAFSDISQMQDDISLYQTERQKVNDVNQQLVSLVERLETVPAADQRKLLVYMPDDVDTIAVPRALQTIAEQSGVLFRQVAYAELVEKYISDAEDQEIADYPVPHAFVVGVQGTYDQIKRMLELLEGNEFPLEVHELSIDVLDGGFLAAEMTVVTYSHNLPVPSRFE